MLIPFSAVIGLIIGLGLWKLAEIDNAKEAAQQINAVGGLGSPWAKVGIPQGLSESKHFWEELDTRFSPAEIAEIELDSRLGILDEVAAAVGVSASSPPPSPSVSTPVSMMPVSQVQPAVGVVATTPQTTGCSDPAVEWLQANESAFPVPLPPPLVQCYSDRQRLIKATSWVAKAIDAGVSQNKVVTVVFGQSKGTANYANIVELYKEVKGHD